MSDVLIGVHPELVARLRKVYAAMAALGWPMKPTDGVRTIQRQQQLYASGRTVPGVIVTKADGARFRSNHQVQTDGLGHAVDAAFLGNDPYLEDDPDSTLKWATYGACVRAVKLKWGGDFGALPDRPHAELPITMPQKVA